MKRTVEELINLFETYANEYRKSARESEKGCCFEDMQFCLGKAEAYEMAVFELKNNF